MPGKTECLSLQESCMTFPVCLEIFSTAQCAWRVCKKGKQKSLLSTLTKTHTEGRRAAEDFHALMERLHLNNTERGISQCCLLKEIRVVNLAGRTHPCDFHGANGSQQCYL